MAGPIPPQSYDAVPTPYHSAHRGRVTRPDGSFDHFLCHLDASHLQGGYWGFASVNDDQRAHARGFSTPEDVVIAQECSEDEHFNEINLRWVRGACDPNIMMSVSGTAAQHLQTIYEVRAMLGMSMSSRGQIPVYPISSDLELRQYWSGKYSTQLPAPIDPTRQVPDRPMPSPITPRAVQASPPQDYAALQLPQSTQPEERIKRICAKKGQAAPLQPVKATPSQGRPNTRAARPSEPPTKSPLSSLHNLPTDLKNVTSRRHVSPDRALTPLSRRPLHDPNSDPSVPRTPRTAPVPIQQTSTYRAPANPLSGVTQHNWVQTTPRSVPVHGPLNEASHKQYSNARAAQASQQAPLSRMPPVPTPLKPYTAPRAAPTSAASRSETRGPLTAFPSRVAPSKGPPTGSGVASHVTTSSNVHTPRGASKSTARTSGNRASQDVHSSARTSAASKPTDRASRDGYYGPTAAPRSLSERRSDVSHVATPLRISRLLSRTPGESPATARASQKSPKEAKQPEHSIRKAIANQVQTESSSAAAGQAVSEPLYEYPGPNEYPELPCMDCGEDDGHKWDCHIGNVKRMENLSVLDYNILADAVQRFDPGPWTTHFNQFPEPESEDGETQVQEMAGVIRNEDSYKDDAELHILPNEAMIMLWAFKTADGVVVINEHNWDLGIGKLETN